MTQWEAKPLVKDNSVPVAIELIQAAQERLDHQIDKINAQILLVLRSPEVPAITDENGRLEEVPTKEVSGLVVMMRAIAQRTNAAADRLQDLMDRCDL